MITRLVDFLKSRGITALFTNLSSTDSIEQTDLNVSSVADTWLLLRNLESDNERKREVLESRIKALQAEFESEAENLERQMEDENARAKAVAESRHCMARERGAP